MTERDIFLAALDHPDRAAYLDAACAGNPELRRRVDALVAAHAAVAHFLEPPADPDRTGAFTADPAAGAVIAGRYKLLERIGEGGMGEVFVAEQSAPVRRRVALKLIKSGMDSKAVLARFEAERQALALMDHPNIAKVLDGGTAEPVGRPYFVMEYVKGVPLTQYCDDARLPIPRRLELFVQVCRAVQHAHQKGVIHRDLKPSNILVALYDGAPVPKVIDFGLAKALHQPLTDRTLYTGHGLVVGTPLYMSPEQAELNNLDVDTRTDIYSLGVILYELLTGTTPLEKQRCQQAAWDEMLRLIREEEPAKPSTRLSGGAKLPAVAAQRGLEPVKLSRLVRGDLDWIALKALAKERDRRYDTANGLAADVERFLGDEPVSAGPPTVGYRLRKFVRRNRAAVVAAALVLLSLLGGAVGATWGLVHALRAQGRMGTALGQLRDEEGKVRNLLAEANEQRRKAERYAANKDVDRDLADLERAYHNAGDAPFRPQFRAALLRLARTHTALPDHMPELRQCVAWNLLAWGQELAPFVPEYSHNGFDMNRLYISPDGRTAITDDDLGKVRVWDALSGRSRHVLDVRFAPRSTFKMSADGRRTFVPTPDNGIQVWDVDSGQLRATIQVDGGTEVTFEPSPDGTRLAVAARPKMGSAPWLLCDALTGRRLVPFDAPGESGSSIAFGPRSDVVATGGDDAVVRVRSAADGRVLHTLTDLAGGSPALAFNATGEYLAAYSGQELVWWRTQDWRPAGRTSCNGEQIGPIRMVGGSDAVALAHAALGDSWLAFRGRPEPHSFAGALACDGQLLLADTGELYEVPELRLRPPPRDRRFAPDVRRFAPDGRRLFLDRFYDTLTDRPIGRGYVEAAPNPQPQFGLPAAPPAARRPDLEVRRVAAVGCGLLIYHWSRTTDGRQLVVLPALEVEFPADVLDLWVRVLVGGELDAAGGFTRWDEATWERGREELIRRAPPVGEFPFPGQVVQDRLGWLRDEANRADGERRLALLDRLIAAEPTWRNYHWRMAIHHSAGRWVAAARDHLEADRLAGPAYNWWKDAWAHDIGWNIVREPGRPAADYSLGLRWYEAHRAGFARSGERTPRDLTRLGEAVARYRLGEYAEVLRLLPQPERQAACELGALLMTPFAAVQFHRTTWLFDLGPSPPYTPYRYDAVASAVVAMAHQKLGQPDLAGRRLQIAREALRREQEPSHDQRAFVREAEPMIEPRP